MPRQATRADTSGLTPAADSGCACARPGCAVVIAVLCGLAGAWLAAGSTGLLAHSLRRVLTCLAMGGAVLACPPGRSRLRLGLLAGGAAIALAMTACAPAPVNVLGVAVLLGALAAGRADADRRALLAACMAAFVLGVYRLACTSVPSLWLAADRLGGLAGRLGGLAAGRKLRVGATFAGVDFLVLTGAMLVCRLAGTGRKGVVRGACAGLAVLGGHLLYLVVLALVGDVRAAAGAGLSPFARALLPWSMPTLAGVIHLAAVAGILRWLPASTRASQRSIASQSSTAGLGDGRLRGWVRAVAWGGAAAAAALLPATALLPAGGRCDLAGRKVVLYEKGYLNWDKPEHGDYGHLSVGMYGMLPTFVESLGGRCLISPDLSAEDLADADVLVLLYPDEPWAPGQLRRIEQFVRGGGALLMMGEHTVRGAGGDSRFNEVLAPTAMRVRFDSAMFAIGGWLQSYEALAHPTTAGLDDDRNGFGVVIGASVRASWPARPLLVGRWGWADPGDEAAGAAMMGNRRYDAGEKLGDVVLAAEQRLGKGVVVAFGDTSSLTNGITIGAHRFTSRLLGYLASRTDGQAAWRQAAGLICAVGLIALLAWRAGPGRIATASVVLAVSLAACTAAARRRAEILPSGRFEEPNNLAYVDTGHLGAHSDEAWRPDGLMGLKMTLMRSGYLTLSLRELTPERLGRAGLLVSVAPSRAFSPAECAAVRKFVEGGGVFVLTVGYDRRGGSREILDEFGFTVGVSVPGGVDPPGEPQPRGHFKSPYLDTGTYRTYVRYHAAWPVTCDADENELRVIAYCPGDVPAILMRKVGRGKVVVVGDTGFAMNKNLEHEGGQPFEGMRENADFWRWFLTVLRDQPSWIPPPQAPPHVHDHKTNSRGEGTP